MIDIYSPLSSNNLLSCMQCLILYTWITGALSILCFNLTKIVFPHLKKRKNANVRTTNGKPKIRNSNCYFHLTLTLKGAEYTSV